MLANSNLLTWLDAKSIIRVGQLVNAECKPNRSSTVARSDGIPQSEGNFSLGSRSGWKRKTSTFSALGSVKS